MAISDLTDVFNRVFREFKRYTGDGLANEPIAAPLPIGDPSTGVHSPKKSELRSVGEAMRTAYDEIKDVADEFGDVATIAAAVDADADRAEAARDAAIAAAGLALGISRPKGRLTLASGSPVTAANFTAATHVYYAPFEGSAIPIWDGAVFNMELFTQLDLVLDGDTGHTAYHQSGKNFDLFVFDVSGTLWLGTGPAWTSDTVRSAVIELKEGLWVNSASMQARFANGPTNYATIAANKATMVGTMRASANGQIEFTPNPSAAAGGSNNKLFLANIYNRQPVLATCRDSTTVWSTTNQTVHQTNDSGNNRISFIIPLSTDSIQVEHFNTVIMLANPTLQRGVYLGVGLDTTTSISGDRALAANNTTELTATALRAEFAGTPGAGFHYVQAMEAAFDSGTVSLNGAPYQGLRACVWS